MWKLGICVRPGKDHNKEDTALARVTFDLPTMYGDHHVIEVRRLLYALAGVKEVYASSGFRVVEVDYDDAVVDPSAMESILSESGYSSDFPAPVEAGTAAMANGNRAFFRHTAAYAQTGRTVSFAQKVPFSGQPLWPCPGLGVIENKKE